MSEPQRIHLLGRPSTPFPKRQLFILGKSTIILASHSPCRFSGLTCATALCRICEPIAFMSIFPYIYYMVESFKITSDDRQIAVYAGMVTSAFAFAEFSTGVLWGRLSDKVGRKPVLLTGLAGTGLSMLIFGFAPSLPVALLARALGGLLNGYVRPFCAPHLRGLCRADSGAQKHWSLADNCSRVGDGKGTSAYVAHKPSTGYDRS
jgi:MFS family permease